jgi:hypothetical protein
MSRITRAIQAFFTALSMTLRGESLPPVNQPLWAWMQQIDNRVDAVYAAAERAQIDQPARQAFLVRADGRDISLETILAAVRHHVTEEYPYLLRHVTSHNLTAIYASNLNDHYRVIQIQSADALVDSALKTAVADLAAHLEAIPRIDSP